MLIYFKYYDIIIMKFWKGNLFKKEYLINMKKVLIMGLGYVGINVAYSFSKKIDVIGYDINKNLIDQYKNGIDYTNEVGNKKIKSSNIFFTNNSNYISKADIIIVAVPTPVDDNYMPNLKFLYDAVDIILTKIKKGSLIIFESTVSPGTTNNLIKKIEKKLSITEGKDFYVGYSPERINPGDNKNKICNSVKILSANNIKTINKMIDLYSLIIPKNKLYIVNNIMVAEAAKIIENTQRDVNIAFMNEINRYLHSKDISSKEVFDAMQTKWNALGFTHGLVGGHCIGVDPYYLINSCNNNVKLNIISSSREENENFSSYLIKRISKVVNNDQKIGIIGFSYKPNVNDVRNTKVFDLYNGLKNIGYDVYVTDKIADSSKMMEYYGVNNYKSLKDLDAVILAVPHKYYIDDIGKIIKMFNKKQKSKVLIDIYNVLDLKTIEGIKIERI